jgi:hypothetical protein
MITVESNRFAKVCSVERRTPMLPKLEVILGIIACVPLQLVPSAHAASPDGVEFQVNTHTSDRQYFPAVATDAAGNFVVVWTSSGQDGDDNAVFGQRFSSSGTFPIAQRSGVRSAPEVSSTRTVPPLQTAFKRRCLRAATATPL